jgi:WD40 repeat protein
MTGEPKLLETLENAPYPLRAVEFGRDGKILYAAAGHGVRRWRTEMREELPSLEGPLTDVEALAVAPDGRVYAGGRDDVRIHVWDAEGKHDVPWEGHKGGVTGLSLTTDGKRLASVARDGTCRVWDTATGATTAVTEDKSQGGHDAHSLPVFSPDGTLLAVAADYNKISVLRTSQLKALTPPQVVDTTEPTTEPAGVAAVKPAKGGFFNAVAISDNGTLLTADADGLLRRWDWPAGKLRDSFQHNGIRGVGSSRNGKVVAVYDQPAVVLRDGGTGKLLAVVRPEQMNKAKYAWIESYALSPEGDLLALGVRIDKIEELVIFDVKAGRQVAVVRPKGSVSSLDFSPDGKTLAASLTVDRCVALFSTETWKETKRLASQEAAVQTVAFSPDGKKLATSTSRGHVVLWDVGDDRSLWSGGWTLANAARQPLRFSPDGKWLAAATRGRMVLLDAATGKLRAEVTRTPNSSAEPAFTPDGRYLAVVRGTYMPIVVYDMEKLLAAP